MSETLSPSVPWSDLIREGHLPKMLILCFGVWLYAADSTLVATVMPSVVDEIGGLPYLNWTYTLYQLGSVVTGAVMGLLVLRSSIARASSTSGICYILGCSLSGYAPDMYTMIIGRLLQGMGGGGLVSIAFIGASTLFPKKLWVRIIAVISGVWGSSALCGPLIGGYFVSSGNWRGAFWAFAFQGLIAVLAGLLLLKSHSHKDNPIVQKIPYMRLGILSLSVLTICQAGVVIDSYPAIVLWILGLILLFFFLKQDFDSENRIFPKETVNPLTISGSGLLMLSAFFMATISFTVYGPFLMFILFGAEPLLAGYIIALESLGWTGAAIVSSGAKERYEPLLIRIGAILISITSFALVFIMPIGPLWAIGILSTIMGIGYGMSWSFVSKRIIANVPETERTHVSASIPTFMRVSMALGSAFSGIIANYSGFSETSSPDAARNVAFWCFAAFIPLVIIGTLCAFRVSKSENKS